MGVNLGDERFPTPKGGEVVAQERERSQHIVVASRDTATAPGAANFLVVTFGNFVLPFNALLRRLTFNGFANPTGTTLDSPIYTRLSIGGYDWFYQPPLPSTLTPVAGTVLIFEKTAEEGTANINLMPSNLYLPANTVLTISATGFFPTGFVLNDVFASEFKMFFERA